MKKESLKLFFYKDSQLFKKVVIKEDFSLMLGSSSNCDLIISNKRISRNHCQIIYSNSGELKLIDLNSTNGTFLNGIKLKSEKTYNLNGNMYLIRAKYFKEKKQFITEKTTPIIMDEKIYSVDIDDPQDYELANIYAKERNI